MISDSDHPLANVNVPIVQGNRYEDVVIPCKPTSKNIEVQLIKDGDEVILHSNFIFRSDCHGHQSQSSRNKFENVNISIRSPRTETSI